jgi:hypothetical protein
MSRHVSKLGRKQKDAIAALLSQRNLDEAARTAGISTRTLIRWMKDPEFDAAYRKGRRLAFGQSVARLQQASGAAVSTLLKIMVDPAAPPRLASGLPTVCWTTRPNPSRSKTSRRE